MEKPDLNDLVGDDMGDAELDALRDADELLRAAEPLPELPDGLAEAVSAIPHTHEQMERKSSRRQQFAGRRPAVLAAAAALAGIAFAIGWLVRGGDDGGPGPTEIVTLEATQFAGGEASMVIDVFPIDEGGNWVLLADIEGLEPVGAEQHYELWLTRNNRVAASCGRFLVDDAGKAQNLWFNAPYRFSEFDDWVVTREGPGDNRSRVLLRAPVTTRAS
ncbi:MAG: anti-sigma factor domain-containing protein [Gaiellaceae bacterium]